MNISSNIKAEVGKYAFCYATQTARKRFSLKYLQCEFKWSTVNTRKQKLTKGPESRVGQLIRAETLIIGICLAGVVISLKVFTPIGAGILKESNPNYFPELEGNFMTDMWGQGVLKSIAWVKHKGSTGKVEPSKQLLGKQNLIFKCLSQKFFMSMIYHDGPWQEFAILHLTWKIHL